MDLKAFFEKVFDEAAKSEGPKSYVFDYMKFYEDAKKLGYNKSLEEFEVESKEVAKEIIDKLDPEVLKGIVEKMDGSKISDEILAAAAGGRDKPAWEIALSSLCG